MAIQRVSIPFAPVDAHHNPNSRAATLHPYYAAMVTAFGSFVRFSPDVELRLVTSAPPPEPWGQELAALGVEVDLLDFEHRPPEGFAPKFLGSLYLLDALAHADPSRVNFFIDPDVVCVRPIEALTRACGARIGAIALPTPPDAPINGLTRQQAWQLHPNHDPDGEPPTHLGGEIYVVPPQALPALQRAVDQVWDTTLTRFSAGERHYPTEEHILMAILHEQGYVDISDHARRIWTAHHHRTVRPTDRDLTLWHLPAEKDRGFAAMEPVVRDRGSWFWTGDDDAVRQRLGRTMGLWNRSPVRLAKDGLAHGLEPVRRALRRARTR